MCFKLLLVSSFDVYVVTSAICLDVVTLYALFLLNEVNWK